MVERLRLSRDQIAKIVGGDPEAIRQFEKLFAMAGSSETNLEDVSISAGAADNKAGQALDQLQQFTDALGVVSLAPVARHDNAVTTDYVQFGIGANTPIAAGRMWYNQLTGSVNVGMGGGNITQQIGEELFVYGKASATIADSPLQIIRKTGTVGASGTITLGPTGTGITDGDLIIGIATENIALNAFGRITSFGIVRGIDTTGSAFGEVWADGDTIWYNPVTGNPTNVKPVAPNIKVSIGIIINAGSGGSGSVQVEINHGTILGGTDSNVQLTAATNGDLLQYYGVGGYWRNLAASSVAVTSFSGGTTGLTPAVATQGAVTLAGTLAVANGGTGTSTAFTAGSIVFAGPSGVYSQDNGNLFWDDANNRLGVGISTPSYRLDVSGDIRNSGLILQTNAQRIQWGGSNVAFISGVDGTTASYIAFGSNGNERARLAANGNLTLNSGAFGYSAGAGGTVTQITNKATAVTLNKVTGTIVMNGAALAAATIVTFVFNNSTLAADDMIICTHHATGTFGGYTINARVTGSGAASVAVRNNTAGSLSESIVIKFAVIKSVVV